VKGNPKGNFWFFTENKALFRVSVVAIGVPRPSRHALFSSVVLVKVPRLTPSPPIALAPQLKMVDAYSPNFSLDGLGLDLSSVGRCDLGPRSGARASTRALPFPLSRKSACAGHIGITTPSGAARPPRASADPR
jgi:hypothetical protein